MYCKVSEIADRFRVTPDAVYLWVRTGVIPTECVDRVGATIRIDADQFHALLKEGRLCRPRGRKRREDPSVSAKIPSGMKTTYMEELDGGRVWQHKEAIPPELPTVAPFRPDPAPFRGFLPAQRFKVSR